jgi:hypothetical protein
MHQDKRFILPETVETLSAQGLVALRNVRTGKLEGVSYTAEGLKYIVDKTGRSLFYTKTTKKVIEYEPHLVNGKRVEKPVRVSFYGTFQRNPQFEVVAYVPINHITPSGYYNNPVQSSEIYWIPKAYAMIKQMNSRLEYLDDMVKQSSDIEEIHINENMSNVKIIVNSSLPAIDS